jgi:glucan phosphorylase
MLEPRWRSGTVWSWTGIRRSRARRLLIRSAYIVRISRWDGVHKLIQLDLSLEFLMGRALDNAMLNVEQKDVAESKLKPPPLCH